jgi:hypothetical protein
MSIEAKQTNDQANQKPPTREQIAYVIRQKKAGFQIPEEMALEMADAILALWRS